MYKIASIYVNTKNHQCKTLYFKFISKKFYTLEHNDSEATLFKTKTEAINALKDCGINHYWHFYFLEV